MAWQCLACKWIIFLSWAALSTLFDGIVDNTARYTELSWKGEKEFFQPQKEEVQLLWSKFNVNGFVKQASHSSLLYADVWCEKKMKSERSNEQLLDIFVCCDQKYSLPFWVSWERNKCARYLKLNVLGSTEGALCAMYECVVYSSV